MTGVPEGVGNMNDQNLLQPQNMSLDVENQQNEITVTDDAQAGVQQIQNNVIEERADIHWPQIITEENSTVTLELPILGEYGVETNVTLPVAFDGTNEHPDLSNVSLTEVESNDVGLPSEIWNADVEALFLPEKGSPKMVTKKSNAASSRILTSSEILQAKAQQKLLKEQKAIAAEERKKRAQERKLKAEEKRKAKAAKMEKMQ